MRRGGGAGSWRPAPARLPHSFSRARGPRGSAASSARRELGRGAPTSAQGPGRPGHFLAAAFSVSRCPRATMSDPAVNAQLDGIISDFEGGCRAGCGSAQKPLGRDGCSEREAGPLMGRPPAARPASPTWRTAAARASFLLLLFVCAERGQPPRGLLGLPRNYRERSFPLGRRSVPSPRRSRSAFGPLSPAAGRGVSWFTHPCVLLGRTAPSPTPVSGLGLRPLRAGMGR